MRHHSFDRYAGVETAELELDDIHSTDPEIVDNMENVLSRSGGTSDKGDRMSESSSKPGQEETSKSARSYDTTSDSTSHGETMIERDKENLSVQSGVKLGGWVFSMFPMQNELELHEVEYDHLSTLSQGLRT